MSMNRSDREQRIKMVGKTIGRRFSTAVVLFHSAVAERLGVNVTDWKFAEVLTRTGPTNPGKLSDLTGMTSAATTQVINRLEKSGLVKRERDPLDRRKVIVKLVTNPDLAHSLGEAFTELEQEVNKMLAHYNSKEIDIINQFIEHTTEILETQAVKLRQN